MDSLKMMVCLAYLLGKVDDALEVDLAPAADVDLLVAGAGDARAGLCNGNRCN